MGIQYQLRNSQETSMFNLEGRDPLIAVSQVTTLYLAMENP